MAFPNLVNIGSSSNDGTGDPLRTALGKVNAKFARVPNVRDDFGAVADGTTDDYAAFRAMIDYCRDNDVSRAYVPSGVYYLSQELEIDAQMELRGDHGISFNHGSGTILRFPKNVNGLRVCRGSTSASGGLADDAIIANMELQCVDESGTSGHGIVLEARAKLVNMRVTLFAGDGIHIDATAPDENANCWAIERCYCTSNRRDGIFVNGADANAGYAIGINCASNGRNNIADDSFLGNTYFQAHASAAGKAYWVKGSDNQAYACILDHYSASNTVPVTGADWATYWELADTSTSYAVTTLNRQYYADGGRNYKITSNNNRTNLVGCYSESGTPRVDLVEYPSQITGGFMSATTVEGNPIFPGGRGLDALTTDGSVTLTSYLGDRENNASLLMALGFKSDDQSTTWRLQYNPTSKIWSLQPNNSSASRCFYIVDNGGSTGLPSGCLDFNPLGLAIGGKRHFYGTAAPGSETWARGDIVYNTAPAALGFVGWVCVTAGTPGTWKGFGVIEA
jgi:hypothetical protein